MTRPILLLAALAMLAAGAQAQDLSAYPNPYAGGPFTVQADAPDAAFELLDVLGRRVDARQTLAPGAYLWRLRYADGSRSTAQRLTVLTPGPLDVRLASTPGGQAAAPALAPVSSASLASAARGGGCAPSPGGALFGGFYHAPGPGTTISGGTELSVQGGPSGSAFEMCVPGLSSVGYGEWVLSPFKDTDEELQISFSGTLDDDSPVSGALLIQRDPSGTKAIISGGLDPSVDRRAEVIRFDPDGTPVVVASATISGGTPLTEPFVSASIVVDFRLMETVLHGPESENPLQRFRPHFDSLYCPLYFRAGAPMTFQLNGQPAVEGDAVALVSHVGGDLAINRFAMDASTSAFEGKRLGFVGLRAETTARPALAQHGDVEPAWLRMLDPNGFMTSDMGTLEIRCGQGETCASYGVEASTRFGAFGHEAIVKTAPASANEAASFYGGPFSAAPGRGLLLDRLDEFRSDAYYRYELTNLQGDPQAVQRRAVATLAKPRENKTSVRVDDLAPDALAGGDTPAFSRFRLRYIKNGRVRLSKVFVPGRTYVFKARLEVLDALVTQGEDGPLFRYAISLNGGEEFLELEPILDGDPTVTGYQKIEWTYTEPWSLGVAGWDEGVAARPAPWAEGASEDWVFEIE